MDRSQGRSGGIATGSSLETPTFTGNRALQLISGITIMVMMRSFQFSILRVAIMLGLDQLSVAKKNGLQIGEGSVDCCGTGGGRRGAQGRLAENLTFG